MDSGYHVRRPRDGGRCSAGQTGVEGPAIETRAVERRLLFFGGILVALFAWGTFGGRSIWFDLSFGVEAWRGPGPVAFLCASVALLLLLAVPAVADRLADLLGLAVRPVPAVLRTPVVVAAFAVAGLLLTNVSLSGDALSIVVNAQLGLGEIVPSNALTSYLHSAPVDLAGLDGREAIRLVSVAAGAVYAAAAVGIGRRLFPDPARRVAAAALLLFAGTGAFFFGTIEVYPTLAAGTAVYLLFGLRHLERPYRIPWPAVVLGVVFTLHGSAGLLLPSLVLLANDGKFLPWRIGRWFAWGAAFLVPVAAVFCVLWFVNWGGMPPESVDERYGNFLGAMGQSPLLVPFRTPVNLDHRYALLDPEHLVGVVNLWLLAGGASLALLFAAIRRPWREARFRFAAVAAAFLLAFPVFWNVSYSLPLDWDLFGTVGAPLAVLAGIAFLGTAERRGTVLGAALLALYAFAPLVLSNAGGSRERLDYAGQMVESFRIAAVVAPPERVEAAEEAAREWERRAIRDDARETRAALARAGEHIRAGSHAAAEADLRLILDVDPDHPRALGLLGTSLMIGNRQEEARVAREAAVRSEHRLLDVWVELARHAHRDGDDARAIRYLERGIRVHVIHPWAPHALRDLAAIRRRIGDDEIALALERVADTRDQTARPSGPR